MIGSALTYNKKDLPIIRHLIEDWVEELNTWSERNDDLFTEEVDDLYRILGRIEEKEKKI